TTGTSHRSVNLSGNNTWDKGTDTSSSSVTPYPFASCPRTSTTSSHLLDTGYGDYSVNGNVDVTINGAGTTYSGGVTRTTHGHGDTTDTKTQSWTDECSDASGSSKTTTAITAGDVGDYT